MSKLTLAKDLAEFQEFLPPLSREEESKLEGHFQLLQQWNEMINLVSRKSIGTAFAYHYADSLHMVHAVAKYLEGLEVFDIGSGGGFPGIIFSIHYPQTRITLFEKSLKKQTFLAAVVSGLNLTNVTLEQGIPPKLAKGFYFCRAVFPREEIFHKLGRVFEVGALLAVASGASNPKDFSSKAFAKCDEFKYSLPADAGDRKLEIFRRI